MKTKKHSFAEHPAYKSWVKKRDRALERLHTRAQLETADVMRGLITHTLHTAKGYFHQLKSTDQSAAEQFDHAIKQSFAAAGQQFYMALINLRRQSYVLAKASESEIIARMIHGSVKASVTHNDLHRVQSAASFAGGPLAHRIKMYMDKMRRRVVNQVQSSAFADTKENDFLIDVLQAFPKARVVNQPRRILKPELMSHREADDPSDIFGPLSGGGTVAKTGAKTSASIDFVDDAAWQDMLAAHTDEYVPQWRGPESIVDLPTKEGDTIYAWELERDLTNEFVQSVRDGQIDAANENGITDFVVIAILDNLTCDSCCGDYGCSDFDGMLVSEIEEMTGGEYSTPAYHFFCRCTLAPATDQLPEKPDDGMAEFDDWLNAS